MTHTRILSVRPAGPDHQVVSVQSDSRGYRRRPCEECPWRVDRTGVFPVEAFYASARTAEDMAISVFGCHTHGHGHPVHCAGFLLRGGDHNLALRMAIGAGKVDPGRVTDGGHELYSDYRAMAVANGCDPDDPRIRAVRVQ